jgi:hypothetical protein
LPPEQTALQAAYKKRLADDFGIVFNNLFTLSNMPVKRFADFLHKRGELQGTDADNLSLFLTSLCNLNVFVVL